MDSLYVAWQYVRYNKGKTATLVACITLVAFLPLVLNRLLAESERQLAARAATTPLVVGAKGSSLDLVMSSLYFGQERPERITMAAADQVAASELAVPIPLYVRFRARDLPIVGTTLDYFDFRGLTIDQGRTLALLGECVLGATAADRLGLGVGDPLLSSPESWFDLAGVYPLKMRVVGILAPTHTSDDLAVFVDLKTAWVIEGLGHGHQDVTRTRDASVILKRTDENVAANAKLMHFQEVTAENLDSFHFHGDTSIYPITAVIVAPYDTRSGTILRGRYLDGESETQIAVPADVIDGLLQNLFRIKNVIDAVIAVVGLATALAIVLVFALSLRLRKREVEAIFKMGCSRLTIARLMAAEVAIIMVGSATLCAALLVALLPFEGEVVRELFLRSSG